MNKLFGLSRTITLIALAALCVSCNNTPQSKQETKVYKMLVVERSNTTIESRYSASIRGEQFVDIRPQVSGVITHILIDEGAKIHKGESLFVIDQVPYRAALSAAQANVKSAEANVATAELNMSSAEKLYNNSIISEHELNVTRNALESAKASLAQAEASATSAANNLSYTVVKSPVDGVASMIPYRVGALVSSSIAEPLVCVSNNRNMYAYFSISESQLLSLMRTSGSADSLIARMDNVKLLLNDGMEYNHMGRVDAISGSIDRATGSVSVRAVFENPEQMLRDGGSGGVVIASTMDSVIVVPKIATFEIQNKIFAYRVDGGIATSTELKVYPYNNGREYVVESGLEVGDVIIAEGAGLIREGAVVSKKE